MRFEPWIRSVAVIRYFDNEPLLEEFVSIEELLLPELLG